MPSGLEIQWSKNDAGLYEAHAPNGRRAEWAPQPGSQQAFLDCPFWEVLYAGTRGPGKTDALIMDFAQHVGQGFGADWNGIIFRQDYERLKDVIRKSKKWFSRMFPLATYNDSHKRWTWPGGETLEFGYMRRVSDYYSYHGKEWAWMGWEELTTFPTDEGYRLLMSCVRSSNPLVPKKIRSTSNPYGPGHNWVRERFHLPVLPGRKVGDVIECDDPELEGAVPENHRLYRCAIHGRLEENLIFLAATPNYRSTLLQAARNEAERRAWMEGDWDIVAGGMFDDLWAPNSQVLPNFPPSMVPDTWIIDRSYDHGQSSPFSVGWWAESNGESFQFGGRTIGPVPGDLVRIGEWYGWNGRPNEGIRMLSRDIARGILEREEAWGIAGRVKPGPADTQIFSDESPGRSVASDMRKEGVRWKEADKSKGSRKHGWEQMRKMLAGAVPSEDGYREEPGMFVTERCTQFLRTIPVLPRHLDKDMDDVDTDSEDHVADEVRYRVRWRRPVSRNSSW